MFDPVRLSESAPLQRPQLVTAVAAPADSTTMVSGRWIEVQSRYILPGFPQRFFFQNADSAVSPSENHFLDDDEGKKGRRAMKRRRRLSGETGAEVQLIRSKQKSNDLTTSIYFLFSCHQ